MDFKKLGKKVGGAAKKVGEGALTGGLATAKELAEHVLDSDEDHDAPMTKTDFVVMMYKLDQIEQLLEDALKKE